MITLAKIRKANTIDELEALGVGHLDYTISDRGGYLGFYRSSIAEHFKIREYELTNKVGVYVNYLGGGMRGSLIKSEIHRISSTTRKIALVSALIDACERAYTNAENDMNLNDEEDEDGDTNWNALATAAARNAGIGSAY